MIVGTNESYEEASNLFASRFFSFLSDKISINSTTNNLENQMLHKTDKGMVYGVRGIMPFLKEKQDLLPKSERDA